jgi:hypothetical protein
LRFIHSTPWIALLEVSSDSSAEEPDEAQQRLKTLDCLT